MKLTVLCPAIRTERWVGMYNSIDKAFSGTWELIIISSKQLPDELKDKPNINLVYSRRSPMGKQQEGLVQAKGEYITVVSDDSVFFEGALDKVFADGIKEDITVMKYLEGPEFEFPRIHQIENPIQGRTNYDFMKSDYYYWTDTHDSSKMRGIPHHSPILSVALIKRDLLIGIGGWECKFSSQAVGNNDLAARLMINGCKYEIKDIVVSKCGYMEEGSGDHGPIHYAQLEEDQPRLEALYRNITDRKVIDIDNWKKTPEVWARGGDRN